MSNFELTITKTIPASPKVVFEAWLSSDALARFMIPMDGMTVPKAECDAREGGDYLIVMQAGDQEMPHSGTYKKIDPFSELSFTWNNPFNETESLVTLHFSETESGSTELTLEHTGLPSEESKDNHHGGWMRITQSLQSSLAA